MTDLVFDAEPLIAYFYDEPGGGEVRDRLRAVSAGETDAAIADATAAELGYKIARLETGAPNRVAPTDAELDVGRRDVRVLQEFGVAVETPPWETVARTKATGGISLGDAFAAALAASRDATLVVGADPEFGELTVDVEVERIRDKPA